MVIRMVIRMVSRMVIRMVSRMVILWLYGVLEGPHYSTMVKTALSQMSFHDCGFNSRNGFDFQISRVPVHSYDRGIDGRRRGGVSPGPI